MLGVTNATSSRRRKLAKAAVRISCGWIARVDRRIAARPAALDGASCTFYLGRRRVAPSAAQHAVDVVHHYEGAQTLKHS